MESNTNTVKKTIIYTNEKYHNIDYLNTKKEEARDELNSDLSTCIIKNVIEEECYKGFKHYYLSGYVIVRYDWEYYSDGSFIITEDEAEYIKEINAELYRYPLGDYSVGTDKKFIV